MQPRLENVHSVAFRSHMLSAKEKIFVMVKGEIDTIEYLLICHWLRAPKASRAQILIEFANLKISRIVHMLIAYKNVNFYNRFRAICDCNLGENKVKLRRHEGNLQYPIITT